MRYGSVCSGIEAATVAWHPLGWTPAWFSEIEPFPCAVLAHHYPDVLNLGDMTRYREWPDAPIDLLVGGTPCQAFSVAGLRHGLDDPRGNLTLAFLGVVERTRPRWVVWENVPGILSDSDRAFGQFLDGLAELGYGYAWRVLDAQYFGVPQRRRRVFVVGYFGDWHPAAAVLFEPESLSGDSPPRRGTGEGITYDVAPCIGASGRGFERTGDPRGNDAVVANQVALPITTHCGSISQRDDDVNLIASAVTSKWAKGSGGPAGSECGNLVTHARRAEGFDASEDGTGRGTPIVAAPLSAGNNANSNAAGRRREDDENLVVGALRSHPYPGSDTLGALACEVADTLSVGADQTTGFRGDVVATSMAVRRLTPRECSRLQGFPDDYTLIPYRGKPAADGPRYKALGNSMAVPVMRWIGERIARCDAVLALTGRAA